MVGKRVLVEWIGLEAPRSGGDEDLVEVKWSDNVTYLSRQIGKIEALILEGYNEFGIEVRTGLDKQPHFVSWNAVLTIKLLSESESFG
jgi:hypothetical protein